ncbi:MAG: SUMF1/EgtB/PvdO family nonheme iron enzyme [Candidatus Poribacteria bacterium]|nr:SUMF1/EgtB/PvdO family nonheme iron enzyme [Candidatus Poribacteria bacterium]
MFPIDKPIKVTFMLSGTALQSVEIWSPEGWSPIYDFKDSPPKDHTTLFVKDTAEWRELELIPGDFNEPSGISDKLQLGRYRGPVRIVETSGQNIGADLPDTVQEGDFKVFADGGNIYLQDVTSEQAPSPITVNGKSYHPDIAIPLNGTDAYVVYTSSAIGDTVSSTSTIDLPARANVIATDGMHLYWADTDSDKIQRANLDGSGVTDLATETDGVDNPTGIFIHDNYLYWANTGSNRIQRTDPNGSNIVDLVQDALLDTNNSADIFVRNTQTGATTRVSLDSSGAQANGDSSSPSISGDGRYIAFESNATNLVAVDTNGSIDIFVHDTQTGTTARVSLDSSGAQATGDSNSPSISNSEDPLLDGRYITFESAATNLVADDSNSSIDTFVYDTQTSTTTRVSLHTKGTEGNNNSNSPGISSDGRYITFSSNTDNLVGNPVQDLVVDNSYLYWTNGREIQRADLDGSNIMPLVSPANGLVSPTNIAIDSNYLYWIDTATQKIQRANLNGSLDQGPAPSIQGVVDGLTIYNNQLYWIESNTIKRAEIDGTLLIDLAPNLTSPSDLTIHNDQLYWTENGTVKKAELQMGPRNIYLYETQTKQATQLTDGNEDSDHPSITVSSDGNKKYIAFASEASNLVGDNSDTNGKRDIFLYDFAQRQTIRLSLRSDGLQANDDCNSPDITIGSNSNLLVVYDSVATTLVLNDCNQASDIFLTIVDPDQITAGLQAVLTTERVSITTDCDEASFISNGLSDIPSISADGRYVVFRSNSINLDPIADTGLFNIFVHDRLTQITQLASLNQDGLEREETSSYGRINPAGDKITYVLSNSDRIYEVDNPPRPNSDDDLKLTYYGLSSEDEGEHIFEVAIGGKSTSVPFYLVPDGTGHVTLSKIEHIKDLDLQHCDPTSNVPSIVTKDIEIGPIEIDYTNTSSIYSFAGTVLQFIEGGSGEITFNPSKISPLDSSQKFTFTDTGRKIRVSDDAGNFDSQYSPTAGSKLTYQLGSNQLEFTLNSDYEIGKLNGSLTRTVELPAGGDGWRLTFEYRAPVRLKNAEFQMRVPPNWGTLNPFNTVNMSPTPSQADLYTAEFVINKKDSFKLVNRNLELPNSLVQHDLVFSLASEEKPFGRPIESGSISVQTSKAINGTGHLAIEAFGFNYRGDGLTVIKTGSISISHLASEASDISEEPLDSNLTRTYTFTDKKDGYGQWRITATEETNNHSDTVVSPQIPRRLSFSLGRQQLSFDLTDQYRRGGLNGKVLEELGGVAEKNDLRLGNVVSAGANVKKIALHYTADGLMDQGRVRLQLPDSWSVCQVTNPGETGFTTVSPSGAFTSITTDDRTIDIKLRWLKGGETLTIEYYTQEPFVKFYTDTPDSSSDPYDIKERVFGGAGQTENEKIRCWATPVAGDINQNLQIDKNGLDSRRVGNLYVQAEDGSGQIANTTQNPLYEPGLANKQLYPLCVAEPGQLELTYTATGRMDCGEIRLDLPDELLPVNRQNLVVKPDPQIGLPVAKLATWYADGRSIFVPIEALAPGQNIIFTFSIDSVPNIRELKFDCYSKGSPSGSLKLTDAADNPLVVTVIISELNLEIPPRISLLHLTARPFYINDQFQRIERVSEVYDQIKKLGEISCIFAYHPGQGNWWRYPNHDDTDLVITNSLGMVLVRPNTAKTVRMKLEGHPWTGCKFPPIQTAEVDWVAGWNLIGLPVNPSVNELSTLFSRIAWVSENGEMFHYEAVSRQVVKIGLDNNQELSGDVVPVEQAALSSSLTDAYKLEGQPILPVGNAFFAHLPRAKRWAINGQPWDIPEKVHKLGNYPLNVSPILHVEGKLVDKKNPERVLNAIFLDGLSFLMESTLSFEMKGPTSLINERPILDEQLKIDKAGRFFHTWLHLPLLRLPLQNAERKDLERTLILSDSDGQQRVLQTDWQAITSDQLYSGKVDWDIQLDTVKEFPDQPQVQIIPIVGQQAIFTLPPSENLLICSRWDLQQISNLRQNLSRNSEVNDARWQTTQIQRLESLFSERPDPEYIFKIEVLDSEGKSIDDLTELPVQVEIPYQNTDTLVLFSSQQREQPTTPYLSLDDRLKQIEKSRTDSLTEAAQGEFRFLKTRQKTVEGQEKLTAELLQPGYLFSVKNTTPVLSMSSNTHSMDQRLDVIRSPLAEDEIIDLNLRFDDKDRKIGDRGSYLVEAVKYGYTGTALTSIDVKSISYRERNSELSFPQFFIFTDEVGEDLAIVDKDFNVGRAGSSDLRSFSVGGKTLSFKLKNSYKPGDLDQKVLMKLEDLEVGSLFSNAVLTLDTEEIRFPVEVTGQLRLDYNDLVEGSAMVDILATDLPGIWSTDKCECRKDFGPHQHHGFQVTLNYNRSILVAPRTINFGTVEVDDRWNLRLAADEQSKQSVQLTNTSQCPLELTHVASNWNGIGISKNFSLPKRLKVGEQIEFDLVLNEDLSTPLPKDGTQLLIQSYGLPLTTVPVEISIDTPVLQKVSATPLKLTIAERILWNTDQSPMVRIPAGRYAMGDHFEQGDSDEKPVHPVELDSFYIDAYEVTNEQYCRFLNAVSSSPEVAASWITLNNQLSLIEWNPTTEKFQSKHLTEVGFDIYPVVGVSRDGAIAYAKWVGKRLPTEAEWEYAARGGYEGRLYPWGNDGSLARASANFGGVGGRDLWPDGPSPVGSLDPNLYGLYDVAGNALEWCLDAYQPHFYGSDGQLKETSPVYNPLAGYRFLQGMVDASGFPSGNGLHVLRGGSWRGDLSSLRVSDRNSMYAGATSPASGFRCAISATDQKLRVASDNYDSLLLPAASIFTETKDQLKAIPQHANRLRVISYGGFVGDSLPVTITLLDKDSVPYRSITPVSIQLGVDNPQGEFYVITNQDYYRFWQVRGESTEYRPEDFPDIKSFGMWPERAKKNPDYPVMGVSRLQAMAFEKWFGSRPPNNLTDSHQIQQVDIPAFMDSVQVFYRQKQIGTPTIKVTGENLEPGYAYADFKSNIDHIIIEPIHGRVRFGDEFQVTVVAVENRSGLAGTIRIDNVPIALKAISANDGIYTAKFTPVPPVTSDTTMNVKTYNTTIEMVDGFYDLHVQIEGLGGEYLSQAIQIDNQPPRVSVYLENWSLRNGESSALVVSGEPRLKVEADLSALSLFPEEADRFQIIASDAEDQYRLPFTIPFQTEASPGAKVITVQAIDQAGNRTEVRLVAELVIYDYRDIDLYIPPDLGFIHLPLVVRYLYTEAGTGAYNGVVLDDEVRPAAGDTQNEILSSETLSDEIPSGAGLVQQPVPWTIDTVSDLYDTIAETIGPDRLEAVVFRDTAETSDPDVNGTNNNWYSYQGRATDRDTPISAGQGFITILKPGLKPGTEPGIGEVKLRLKGLAHGENNHSSIRLQSGLNLMGLPLDDERIKTVGDLWLLNQSFYGIMTADNGQLVSVDPSTVIPIDGRHSYFVTVGSDIDLPLVGDAWSSERLTGEPAGYQSLTDTPVLIMGGYFKLGEDLQPNASKSDFIYFVKITNLGDDADEVSDDNSGFTTQIEIAPGPYQLTMVSPSAPFSVDDLLEITVLCTTRQAVSDDSSPRRGVILSETYRLTDQEVVEHRLLYSILIDKIPNAFLNFLRSDKDNALPVLDEPLSDLEVSEDEVIPPIDLDDVFTDVDIETDSDHLSYQATIDEEGKTLVSASVDSLDNLQLTLKPNRSGRALVTIKATDLAGAQATDKFTLDVASINDPPQVVESLPDIEVDEDASLHEDAPLPDDAPLPEDAPSYEGGEVVGISLERVFTDVDIETDQDALSYRVRVEAASLTEAAPLTEVPVLLEAVINEENRLRITLKADRNGTVMVTVIAQDIDGATVEEPFKVTVNPVNDAPIVRQQIGKMADWQEAAAGNVQSGLRYFKPVLDRSLPIVTQPQISLVEDGDALVSGPLCQRDEILYLSPYFDDIDIETNDDYLRYQVENTTDFITAQIQGDHLHLKLNENGLVGEGGLTITAKDRAGETAKLDFDVSIVTRLDYRIEETFDKDLLEATIDDQGTLTIKPQKNQNGTSPIDVVIDSDAIIDPDTAIDPVVPSEGNSIRLPPIRLSLAVTVEPVNDPPLAVNPIDNFVITEDTSRNVDLNEIFEDVDIEQGESDELKFDFEIMDNRQFPLLDSELTTLEGAILKIVPEKNKNGQVKIAISAQDQTTATAFQQFTVMVVSANDPPVLVNPIGSAEKAESVYVTDAVEIPLQTPFGVPIKTYDLLLPQAAGEPPARTVYFLPTTSSESGRFFKAYFGGQQRLYYSDSRVGLSEITVRVMGLVDQPEGVPEQRYGVLFKNTIERVEVKTPVLRSGQTLELTVMAAKIGWEGYFSIDGLVDDQPLSLSTEIPFLYTGRFEIDDTHLSGRYDLDVRLGPGYRKMEQVLEVDNQPPELSAPNISVSPDLIHIRAENSPAPDLNGPDLNRPDLNGRPTPDGKTDETTEIPETLLTVQIQAEQELTIEADVSALNGRKTDLIQFQWQDGRYQALIEIAPDTQAASGIKPITIRAQDIAGNRTETTIEVELIVSATVELTIPSGISFIHLPLENGRPVFDDQPSASIETVGDLHQAIGRLIGLASGHFLIIYDQQAKAWRTYLGRDESAGKEVDVPITPDLGMIALLPPNAGPISMSFEGRRVQSQRLQLGAGINLVGIPGLKTYGDLFQLEGVNGRSVSVIVREGNRFRAIIYSSGFDEVEVAPGQALLILAPANINQPKTEKTGP